MVITHTVKQGTDEWHGLRVQYPHTASLAYVLLTKGKHAASNKFGVRGTGFWAERGHILEDEAIDIYESVYGVKVERIGFVTNTEYPKCGWSPDGGIGLLIVSVDGHRRGIEVKCFKEEKHLACIDEIPTEVYAQCEFGEMIGELDDLDLIFYNPDIEDSSLCFKVHRLLPDHILFKRFRIKLGME